MQRTLKRELKELEVVGREAIIYCDERLSDRGLNYLLRFNDFLFEDRKVIG